MIKASGDLMNGVSLAGVRIKASRPSLSPQRADPRDALIASEP